MSHSQLEVEAGMRIDDVIDRYKGTQVGFLIETVRHAAAPLDNEQIAAIARTRRSSVSSQMTRLYDAGVVTRDRSRVHGGRYAYRHNPVVTPPEPRLRHKPRGKGQANGAAKANGAAGAERYELDQHSNGVPPPSHNNAGWGNPPSSPSAWGRERPIDTIEADLGLAMMCIDRVSGALEQLRDVQDLVKIVQGIK